MNGFSDIHCHSTLFPFSALKAEKRKDASLWKADPPLGCQRDSTFPEFSQTDFTTLARGGFRLVFVSLYPLEQGWVILPPPFEEGDVTTILANILTHIPLKRIRQIQSDGFNYFRELCSEYEFLRNTPSEYIVPMGSEQKCFYYYLIRNGHDLQMRIGRPDHLCIIPIIEGAHSLISGNQDHVREIDILQVINNICHIKSWHSPPFFITLSHHFNNGLCGHCRSIHPESKAMNIFAKFMLNQQEGMDAGINPNGWTVIRCLLGLDEFTGNGRRILIDTKHLSIRSRIEYYSFINQYNLDHPEHPIPLIASHSGYSGRKTLQEDVETSGLDDSLFDYSTVFNPEMINLRDDEIRFILLSGGLIGLNLDQRILAGKQRLDSLKQTGKTSSLEKIREQWAAQIADNILSIVLAIAGDPLIQDNRKPEIWDCLSIGSDFDGMINPVDGFITAEEIPSLPGLLKQIFPAHPQWNELRLGLDLEEILEKLFFTNAYFFAVRHYRN